MHSSEQSETMTKAFTEVQKKMWESWMGWMRTAPSGMPVSPGVADQWREQAIQAFKGWTTETSKSPRT